MNGSAPRSAEDDPSGWRRAGVRVGLIFLVVGGLSALSLWARARVDTDLGIEGAQWSLLLDRLPTWFPNTFRGELAALNGLPEEVSLRPPYWRERLRERIEANPWIDQVKELRRRNGQIYFRASFVRPVVAVHADGGFLLVSSRGRVVDFQEGPYLREAWRLPEYLGELGPLEWLPPGEQLRGSSYAELMALLEVLWGAHIFDRWSGVVREIASEPRGEGDRLWVLRLAHGTELVWGRAPNSRFLSPLDDPTKLANLEEVLRNSSQLGRTQRIELWSDARPLVVDSR